MKRIALACLIVVATAHAARADSVGVVVTGDPVLQGPVAARIEDWLKFHSFKVIARPIDAEGFSTIGNCLLLDDLDCARGVVEARATSDALVYAQVDVAGPDISVTAWWFVKGHDATHDHGTCAGCQRDGWHETADRVMVSITGANANIGRLELRSRPLGITARIDGKSVGPTPVDRELSSGDHVIVLERDGRRLARKSVTIGAGETTKIEIPVRPVAPPPPPPEVSNAGQIIAIVAGSAAIAGGAYVIYYGHKKTATYDLPHSTPIGIGMASAGVAAIVTGIALWDHGHPNPKKQHVVVSVTDGGALVGFSTRF